MSGDDTDRDRLIRIETKLDTFILSSKEQEGRRIIVETDHEARIRGLEKRLWQVLGAAVVIGAIGQIVVKKVFGL